MKIIIKPLGSVLLVLVGVAVFVAFAVGGVLLRSVFAADNPDSAPVVGSVEAATAGAKGGKITLKCPDCNSVFTTTVPELADMVLPDALRGDQNIRSYPAEEAKLKGAVPRTTGSIPGSLGGGYVEFLRKSGDSVEFAVTAPMDGNYVVAFRYANASPRGQILRVVKRCGDNPEEIVVPAIAFPRTTRQRNWDYVSLNTPLTVGKNAIRIGTTGTGGPALDGMVIIPAPKQVVHTP